MSDKIENPWGDDLLDPSIPTGANQIYQHISANAPEDSKNINRASSANYCFRRRWYQNNGYRSKPLAPRKRINFLLGDLSELVVLRWIKEACTGHGKIYSEVCFGKETGRLDFKGHVLCTYEQPDLIGRYHYVYRKKDVAIEYVAHPDGFGKRNSDGKWELIEIKSSSSYGYSSFIKEGPKDYLGQCHAIMNTDKAKELDIQETRFFYLRKDTGHIYDQVVKRDPKEDEEVRRGFWFSNRLEIPVDPYPKIDKGTYYTVSWICGYCPFIDHCKPGYEMSWKKDHLGTLKPVLKWEKKDAIQKERHDREEGFDLFKTPVG